jgi:hypothetical protein
MTEEQLEESNRSKYGDKEFDQISLNYRKSVEFGDIWASENVKRYLDRFTRPGSSKAGNFTDLLKARDYLNRMIEHHEKINENKSENIE